MHFLTLFATLLASMLSTTLATGPPCSEPRSIPICAEYIRPFSENAYMWQEICDLTEPPNTLIAETVEMYDAEYGWYVFACPAVGRRRC
jgi:hypothetical protein